MPKMKTTSYPQAKSKRKPGQLANEIIKKIIECPEVSFSQLASELQCTSENIRKVYKQIQENLKFYATISGHDFEMLSKVISKRSTRTKTKQIKPKWRGKANWPARQVATKESLSDIEFVRACGQHYTFNIKTQKYEGDQCVSHSGSPGLPQKITLTKMQNMS